MLVLTRRIGESVVINDEIFITVTRIKGNQAVLAFDAPDNVIIHRDEIYQKIQAEKKEQQDKGFIARLLPEFRTI